MGEIFFPKITRFRIMRGDPRNSSDACVACLSPPNSLRLRCGLAHPRAPSRATVDGTGSPLNELIRLSPPASCARTYLRLVPLPL